MGLGLFAATLGVLGAGSNGPAVARYEVTAGLQFETDGRVFACYASDLMFPRDACTGIEIRGVDLNQLRNSEIDPSGEFSQPMRLVGTFDGHVLTLTETPQPAKPAPGLYEPCQQPGGFDGAPGMNKLQIELWDALQAHGITVLETVPCDDTTLGVTVVMADDSMVSWMTRSYPHVKVATWLRRLPSGP